MKKLVLPFACIAGYLFTMGLCGCQKTSSPPPVKDNTYSNINKITATAICDYDFNDTTLTDKGWKKTFEDNFNGDISQWNVFKGGEQNELECYQASNLMISDGTLQIVARKETVTGPAIVGADPTKSFNYTSGWIATKAAFAPSDATPKIRIVARIKVATGYGMASNFWSFGGNWPVGGEIDFAVVQGNKTNTYTTNYFYGTEPQQNLVTNSFLYDPTTADLSACYHVYEMEWTKQSLTSYLDGKLVEVKNSGSYIPDLFNKQQYISLNLSVGGTTNSTFNPASIQTGTMYVDYVKVFASQ